MGLDDLEQVLVTSRAQWREWLEANADSSPGIWLLMPRRGKGNDDPAPSYEDVVEEALCFGWIDSTVRTLDERFGLQLLTPRKPSSTWSASNKERLSRLIPAGMMTERGLRAVEVAKGNGSWEILDSVERLEVPADLSAALDEVPAARDFFDGLPPGALKQNLYFVISAKRPETRAARIEKIVTAAATGRRAVG